MFLYASIAVVLAVCFAKLGALSVWVEVMALVLKAILLGGLLVLVGIGAWFLWCRFADPDRRRRS